MTSHTRGRRPAGSDTRQAIIAAARSAILRARLPGHDDACHRGGRRGRSASDHALLRIEAAALRCGRRAALQPGGGLSDAAVWRRRRPREAAGRVHPRTFSRTRSRATSSPESSAPPPPRRPLPPRSATGSSPGCSRRWPSTSAADRPELRASMIGSQVVGLTFARNVVEVPALKSAERAELVSLLGRVFDIYLRAPLTPADG